jgi:PAS domain S-box-containing protein
MPFAAAPSRGSASTVKSGSGGGVARPGGRVVSEELATGAASGNPAPGTGALVTSILDCVAQPVWVVDQDGLILFANPSAAATLGYDDVSQLLGKPSHQTIHYKRPDGSRFPAQECPMLLPRTTGETVHRSDDWFVRRDGSMLPVEYWSAPIDMPGGRGAVVAFTDLTMRLAAQQADRERDIAEARAAELSASEARQRAMLGAARRAERELQRLAKEQAALRRVATLVAEGAEPRTVFDAVCEETGRLIDAASVNLAHFTPDENNLTIAGWSRRGTHVPTGTRLPLDGQSINALVRRMRAPGRIDSYESASGKLAARLRELGIRSEVGAPVMVDGNVWGALIAGTDNPEPLPAGAELRVASFAELIATAVSNASARSELIESRARMITAFDAARRRVTRDLHDGAQQRFVSAIINLQLAQQKWSSAPEQAKDLLDLALQDASGGIGELREIAAGIHPAILTHRGLAAALDGLAARLPIPVELDVPGARLPPPIESSIYFFCSEALTNIVKHAHASSAWVRVALEGDRCTVEVHDDGIGGADTRPGTSGLIGLRDRIGALKGATEIASPIDGGTTLRAWIPLPREPATPEPGGGV